MILASVWSGTWWLVSTAWGGIYNGIDVAYQAVISLVVNWIAYQFSPVYLVDVAMSLLSWGVNSISTLLPGTVGVMFRSVATFLDSHVLVVAWNLGLFLVSPLIDPAVINLCVDAFLLCWVVSVIFRTIFWSWGQVRSGQG